MDLPAPSVSTSPVSTLPYTIFYQPETQQLNVIWQGNTTYEDLENGYNRALEIIKTQPVTRILLGLSQRKLETDKNPNQLFAAIFIELLKIVSQPLFTALVVPAEEYYLTDEDARFEDMKHINNEFIITKLFPSPATAQAWLDSVS